MLYTTAVRGQECADTVGSLNHGSNIVPSSKAICILAGYIVPCNGAVVAWEFCYRVSNASSVTFFPGIWRITGTNGRFTDYTLVNLNDVTYNQSIQNSGEELCQRFNVTATDQFIAPAGSVVGLHSNNGGAQLLHTNTNSSITTYQFDVNSNADNDTVNYNIAIRVHIGKYMATCITTIVFCVHDSVFVTAKSHGL